MNKTVTANISGVVFHIESNAYEKLHQYLTTIRNYFHDSDGKDEIMADIEARIAELFKEAMEEGKEVVTMANVNKVIEVMGEPEAYMSDTDEDYDSSSKKRSSSEKFYSKKLYRDEDDNVIGGVCSGIGYYFGIDRIWLRAAFLIAFLGFGTGLLLYIILWIIIPVAKTTAEKLEMKGEPINVDSIGNAIKDEFSSFKKKVNNGDTSYYGTKAKHGIYRAFDFLGKILYFLLNFIVKLLAVLLIIASSIAIISIIGVLLGVSFFELPVHNSELDHYLVTDFAQLFFSSEFMYAIGFLGICLVVLIPLLGILYGGLKILFKIPSSSKAVALTAVSLWVIGVILIFISGTSTASQYSSEQTYAETIELPEIKSDTFALKLLHQESGALLNNDNFFIDNDFIYHEALHVDVVKSKTNEVELYVRKSSRGSSRRDAGNRAQNITVEFQADSSNLLFSELIKFPLEDKFRDQEVELSIGLPVGKTIYLDNSSDEFIYDIENVTNTYDRKMLGHHWTMLDKGLSCTDCKWIKNTVEQTEKDESTEP